ncbi:hypothetical protein LTR29_006587 [Friedmanniomyces endolithicus]|nr:hypothetical protein LTR29_006587 [Friedmanniomyces endolithicus]
MAGERQELTNHRAHCFSFHLVAYDDRAPPRDARVGLLTFKVEKLSKGTREQSCEDAVKNAEEDTLPSLIPHAAELAFDPDDPNVTLVTWAGMLPRSERVKQLLGRQVKKGTSVATLDGNIPHVRHDPTAMRVVCFVKGATAIYYALTKQDPTTHLCTGFMIEKETVFYFPELRDDSLTASSKRKTDWSAKVRARSTNAPTKKRPHSALDTVKFVVSRQRSFAMEVESLVRNYEQTGELKYLEAAKAVLLSGVEDKDFAKTVENLSLSRLIYAKELPSDDACYESALQEITKMWPPVGERMTKEELMAIAQGLRHAHVTLPRRIIRLFLNEMTRALESKTLPLDNDTAAEIVQAAVKHIDRGIGIGKPPVGDEDDPPSELARFVLAQALQWERLLDSFHTTLSQLQDFHGAHTVEYTLPEIWAAFGDRPDKDSAKLMAAHLHRWHARATAENFTGIEKEMRALVASQKVLAADLREAQEATEDEAMDTDE